MNHSAAAVLHWPVTFDKTPELLIVAVPTPDTSLRSTARQIVREVLREILGQVELISGPGQPIQIAGTDRRIGISVSHESGLSLVAINYSGPIGVDLLRVPASPLPEEEIAVLARDYLGPDSARRIAELPASAQLMQFAQDWAKHEASLKCLGLGLEEWSTALAEKLLPCRTQKLALPAGYTGAMATLKEDESPSA